MYDVVFNSGFIGFLIWALLFATSTVALAVTIRCFWILRKSRFATSAFHAKLLPLLQAGDWQGAYDVCASHSSLAGKTIEAVLLVAHEKSKEQRQEIVLVMFDRKVKEILRQINTLSMCANIAPMLGLLGTVTGMVDAFMGLGTALGPEKASVLAISISQALYTTAAGLLIAIPAITLTLIFRNLLEKRMEWMTDLLDKGLEPIPEAEPELRPSVPPVYPDTRTMKIG